MAPYFLEISYTWEAGFFSVLVIKSTVQKSMRTGNEGGLTQTDSKIWEVHSAQQMHKVTVDI